MKTNILIIVVLFSILFTGCHQNEVYFEYKTVPSGEWNKDSLIQFNFHIDDTIGKYDMFLHLRHYGNYPYQNAWLFLEFIQPKDSITGTTDTIEFYLADNYGKWLGTGVGALKEMPVYLRKQIQFPDTGIYTLRVKQGMRDSLLSGVNDVGLRIEKVAQ